MAEAERVGRRGRGGGGAARRAERSRGADRNRALHRTQHPESRDPERRSASDHRAQRRNGAGGNRCRIRREPRRAGSVARGGADVQRRTGAHSRAALPASSAPQRRRGSPRSPATPSATSRSAANPWSWRRSTAPPSCAISGGRRYATMADFERFVKLGYMSKWLHHSGGTVCEPTDVPVNKRHFDMLYAHMTPVGQTLHGQVTEPSRAARFSVEMAKILFGGRQRPERVMTSLININSPLTFDSVMMGALEVYASRRAGLHRLALHRGRRDGAGRSRER
jgi:trimethylamine--corrinoid protein Co-methyltransferase